MRGPPRGFLRTLGPGLITGAADDDPSGIATYSQAGAQFGFGARLDHAVHSPLMVGIQMVSARIGRVTGHGIAANMRRHYPRWLLRAVVVLLLVANTINIAADLGAMGEALQLSSAAAARSTSCCSALACVVMQMLHAVRALRAILKWLTLSLFAYVAVGVRRARALGRGAVTARSCRARARPGLRHRWWSRCSARRSALICSSGRRRRRSRSSTARHAEPLRDAPAQAPGRTCAASSIDTIVGMGFSNLVALCIMVATAATLHARGVTDIQTSAQAAEALRPIAGELRVRRCSPPASSAPAARGAGARRLGGLRRRRGVPLAEGLAPPAEAKASTPSSRVATLVGVRARTSPPIDPIKALYWSAVVNGVIAVPIMVVMMLISTNPRIMGRLGCRSPCSSAADWPRSSWRWSRSGSSSSRSDGCRR